MKGKTVYLLYGQNGDQYETCGVFEDRVEAESRAVRFNGDIDSEGSKEPHYTVRAWRIS